METENVRAGLTTPDKPLDITQVFPELASMARVTIRLHPRSGEPGMGDSSMGGPLLWPADEPWPYCETLDPPGQMGPPLAHQPAGHDPLPLVPILQLHAKDVPELPFPDDTDLCQVLWCPTDHGEYSFPNVIVKWRNSTTITAPRIEPPPPPQGLNDEELKYLPQPCALHPERVREFPDFGDLPDELQDRVAAREEEISENDGWSYDYHLSVSPGTKVGGGCVHGGGVQVSAGEGRGVVN